jgi:hypothetical protein
LNSDSSSSRWYRPPRYHITKEGALRIRPKVTNATIILRCNKSIMLPSTSSILHQISPTNTHVRKDVPTIQTQIPHTFFRIPTFPSLVQSHHMPYSRTKVDFVNSQSQFPIQIKPHLRHKYPFPSPQPLLPSLLASQPLLSSFQTPGPRPDAQPPMLTFSLVPRPIHTLGDQHMCLTC